KSYRVVRTAFEIIAQRTSKHPVQILVDAIEKAAPREEITRLRFGGISVPRAVDVAPSRRLDLALRNICVGAVQATFKNRKAVEECLADEILMAAKETCRVLQSRRRKNSNESRHPPDDSLRGPK